MVCQAFLEKMVKLESREFRDLREILGFRVLGDLEKKEIRGKLVCQVGQVSLVSKEPKETKE